MSEEIQCPTLAQIRSNASTLRDAVVRTPVTRLHGRTAEELASHGTEVFLKLESLQHTGSFKVRGALTALGALPSRARSRGVVAVTAGNHGAAVAYAAKQFGVPAHVMMMGEPDPLRLALCSSLGAQVRIHADGPSAFEAGRALVAEENLHLVHPYEGFGIALGTATVGLELLEQQPDLDLVIVAIGGGGLAAGVGAAVRQLKPACRVIGVEPYGADSMWRSFRANSPQSIERMTSIADSLGAPRAEPYSFSLCRTFLEEVVRVTDEDLCRAMYDLFAEAKLVVEPAGAATFAALCGPLRDMVEGLKVGLIVCGANVSAEKYVEQLRRGANATIGS